MDHDHLKRGLLFGFVVMILFSLLGLRCEGGKPAGEILASDALVAAKETKSGKLAAPMEVDLTFLAAPLLDQAVALNVTVESLVDAPNTKVGITLSDGFEPVEGNLTWQGDLPKDEMVELRIMLKAVKEGDWTVAVQAVSEAPNGSAFGKSASLYITVTSTGSTVSKIPPAPTKVISESMTERIAEKLVPAPEEPSGLSPKLRPHREAMGESVKQITLGTITVYGYWYYRDRNSVDHPLGDARVEIWDDDTIGDDLLATVYTNVNGRYEATVPNDDEWGGQDIYVKIWSTDDHSVRVENFSGGKYSSQIPTEQDVPDGSYYAGSWSITDANSRMAWFIYDKIANDAWYYLFNGVGWDNNHNLQVRWTPTSTDGTHYHRGGSIDLLAGDRWDEDVILHEYGHFVVDKIYTTYPPTPNCSPHWWGVHSSTGCAWSEGWATFLQGAIQGHDDYVDTEDQTIHYYMEPPSPVANHAEDEGAISASLWDIFDGSSETWDALANGINGSANNGIWRIVYNDDPNNIQDFWNSWTSSSNGHCAQVWSILDHHSINYDTSAPSNPSSVWSSSHSTSSWSNDNTISMSWSGASDGCGSGVYGYSCSWTTSSSSIPDTTVDTTSSSVTSAPLSDGGNWYFHIRARDNAGNWNGGAVHSGPYRMDTTAPDSAVATLPVSQAAISFVVAWSGDDVDPGSGIGSYDVQYRVGHDGEWVDWLLGTALTSKVFGSLDPISLRDGQTYYFRCRARDNVGNVEHYPAGDGDTWTTVNMHKVFLPLIGKNAE